MVRANLREAHLESADLTGTNLTGTNFSQAHLEKADLTGTQLTETNLAGAHLEGAKFFRAHGVGTNLRGAQLAGADFRDARLERADLRSARLDRETRLHNVNLAGVSLDQLVFDNTNLTVVSWEGVAPLGDDKRARATKYDEDIGIRSIHAGDVKRRQDRIADYEAAVRANRLLATALRTQGLAEEADLFAYRAQLMQRGLRSRRRQYGRWLVSWGLAALSGYGYRLGRIFAAYAIVVLTFAALFLLPTVLNGAIPTIQQAADALQISLNAIHGRVFFVQFGLDTLQSWLATAESVIGIVIEGVFVAMIIQRLFR